MMPLTSGKKIWILIIAVAGGICLVWFTDVAGFLYTLKNFKNENRAEAAVLFILIGGMACSFGFPRILLSSISGFIFGFFEGSLAALAGTMIGSFFTFYYARFLGFSFIEKHFSVYLKKYNDFLSKNSFSATLLVRFFPVGNNMVTNLIAGVSKIDPLPFFTASLIGYIPQTIFFSLIGSGFGGTSVNGRFIGIFLFAFSIMIALYLIKKNRSGKL